MLTCLIWKMFPKQNTFFALPLPVDPEAVKNMYNLLRLGNGGSIFLNSIIEGEGLVA